MLKCQSVNNLFFFVIKIFDDFVGGISSPDGNGILFCIVPQNDIDETFLAKKIQWTAGNSS